MHSPQLVIVAGLSRNDRGIGYKNNLLWHAPEDLKRFKKLTLGHPIIIGKKTFESIVSMIGRPLPDRTNIILTRDKNYTYKGVKIAHSKEEALRIAKTENPTEIHIGGGSELYRQFLPLCTRLHITWFEGQKEADTFFPEFENEFKITDEQPTQEHDGIKFKWVDYERID